VSNFKLGLYRQVVPLEFASTWIPARVNESCAHETEMRGATRSYRVQVFIHTDKVGWRHNPEDAQLLQPKILCSFFL
jgi:hypothetical protein